MLTADWKHSNIKRGKDTLDGREVGSSIQRDIW